MTNNLRLIHDEPGMNKILTFETHTEKGIFLYTLGEGRDQGFLEKSASAEFHPQIADYISKAQKMPGKIQVLLTALGAVEYWGSNVNGDGFPVVALRHDGSDYGHKTFELYAKVYKHHINKDPLKSYGDVVLSVWNERMKRVELIVVIDEAKAPDLVDRINSGEYPEVSMGCKVPYDVCSICSNKAKTRAEYCDHLRYYMNKIPPGQTKRAYAINTLPRFFDISFVLIGADRIAKVLKKVAYVSSQTTHPRFGMSSAAAAEKQASVPVRVGFSKGFTKSALGLSKIKIAGDKQAEIEKEVPSNLDGSVVGEIKEIARNGAEALAPLEPEISKKTITHISKIHPGMAGISRIFSTLGMMGVSPKPNEFQSIVLRCLGKDSLADDYERLSLTFDPDAPISNNHQCSCERQMDISPEKFDSYSFDTLKSIMEDRSYSRPLLSRRVIRLVKLAEDGKLQYPKHEHVKTAEESSKIGLLPMMLTLTGLYVALKNKIPLGSVEGIDKVLLQHPALVTALGITGVTALNALSARNVKGKFDFNPDNAPMQIGTWQEEIAKRNMNPVVKTGGVPTSTALKPAGSLAKRLFMGVPALYMLSGMQDVKRAKNPQQEEGALGSFIRKHPDVASAVLVGEGLAGFPITSKLKGLGKQLLKVGESNNQILRKTSSIADEVVSSAVFSLAFPGSSVAARAATSAVDYGILKGIEKLLSKKQRNQGGSNAKYR